MNDATFWVALGGFFTLAGAYQVWRGWSTQAWTPVQGEITEAFISETEEEEADTNPNTVNPRMQSFYQSRILYKYSVRGKDYEGDTLQRGLFRIPVKFIAQWQAEAYERGVRGVPRREPSTLAISSQVLDIAYFCVQPQRRLYGR